MLAGVQLESTELRPIVASIKEKPGCALLVFGCGNDSALWETVNAGGTTVFLEDNREWADTARFRLSKASVYAVCQAMGCDRGGWSFGLQCVFVRPDEEHLCGLTAGCAGRASLRP